MLSKIKSFPSREYHYEVATREKHFRASPRGSELITGSVSTRDHPHRPHPLNVKN